MRTARVLVAAAVATALTVVAWPAAEAVVHQECECVANTTTTTSTAPTTTTTAPDSTVDETVCVDMPFGSPALCVQADDGEGEYPNATACVWALWADPLPWVEPQVIACAFTEEDKGYLSGPGVCVQVEGMQHPILCVNGKNSQNGHPCLVTIGNGMWFVCDGSGDS